MKRTLALLLLLLAALSASLMAQGTGNPENWCREGLFTHEGIEFGTGFIKVKRGRTFFFKDDPETCPAGKNCRTRSYLVNGDTVITGRKWSGFVCAWYTSPKGGVKVGWLTESDVEFPNLLFDGSENAWVGEWRYHSNVIRIERTKTAGEFRITGDALWKGMGDNIHIGELNGTAGLKDGKIEYSDGSSEFDCKATLDLAYTGYLLVKDNANCGGMNVRFSGIYRKVK